MPVLIDTSSWVHALRERGNEEVRTRLAGVIASGEAAWCEMIRLELWNGARGEEERRRLRDFDRDLPSLEIDQRVWDLSCEVARTARAAGLTVPASDLVIFACSRRHAVRLDHDDRHLDQLAKVLPTTNGRD